jgi:hypothetical protein
MGQHEVQWFFQHALTADSSASRRRFMRHNIRNATLVVLSAMVLCSHQGMTQPPRATKANANEARVADDVVSPGQRRATLTEAQ